MSVCVCVSVCVHLCRCVLADVSHDLNLKSVHTGPRVFMDCAVDQNRNELETWFINLWNHFVIPYLMGAIMAGIEVWWVGGGVGVGVCGWVCVCVCVCAHMHACVHACEGGGREGGPHDSHYSGVLSTSSLSLDLHSRPSVGVG